MFHKTMATMTNSNIIINIMIISKNRKQFNRKQNQTQTNNK